jgi:uncharacterized membrane protein
MFELWLQATEATKHIPKRNKYRERLLIGVVFVMATFAVGRDLQGGLEWTELAFTRVASLVGGRSMYVFLGELLKASICWRASPP